MNQSHRVRSLLWKDYRHVFPFWLTSLLTGIVVLTLLPLGPPELQIGSALMGLSGLIGLVVGITLFTLEHDQKTERFLQWLPCTPGMVHRLKLAVGLLAVICGWLVLSGVFKWAVLRSYFDATTSTYVEQNQWIEFSLSTSLWCFLSTVVVSRWLASSLETAFLALFSVIAMMFALNLLGSAWELSQSLPFAVKDSLEFQYSRGCHWIGAALLASLAAYALPFGHAGDRQLQASWLGQRWRAFTGASTTSRSASYRSLIWLSGRQTFHWILGLMLAILLLTSVTLFIDPIQFRVFNRDSLLGLVFFNFAGVSALVAIASAAVFWPDQRQGTLSFTWQHRLPPVQFWGIRVGCWVLAFALISLVTLSIHSQLIPESFKQIYYHTQLDPNGSIPWSSNMGLGDNLICEFYLRRLYLLPLLLLGILATGQFLSLLFTNGLLALLFQCVVSVITTSWFCLVVDRNEPTGLFVLPGIVAFVAGGYWICRQRLLGRFSVFRAVGVFTLVAVVWLGQYVGLSYHRQFEFSKHEFGDVFLKSTPNGDELWKYPPNLKLAREIGIALQTRNVQELDATARPGQTEKDVIQLAVRQGGYFLIAKQYASFTRWAEISPEREAVQRLFANSPLTPSLQNHTVAEWNTWINCHGLDLAVAAERDLAAGDVAAAWISLRALIHLQASSMDEQLTRYLAYLLLRWSEHPHQTTELLTDAMRSMAYLGQRDVAPYLHYRATEQEQQRFQQEHGWFIWLNPSLAEQVRHYHLLMRDIGVVHRLSSFRTQLARDPHVGYREYELPAAFTSNFAKTRVMQRTLWRPLTITGFETMLNQYQQDRLPPVSYWDVLAESRQRSRFEEGLESWGMNGVSRSDTYRYLYIRFALDRYFVQHQHYPPALHQSSEAVNIHLTSGQVFNFLDLYHYTDERWNDPELPRFMTATLAYYLDYRPAAELVQSNYWPNSQALLPFDQSRSPYSPERRFFGFVSPESAKLNRKAKE